MIDNPLILLLAVIAAGALLFFTTIGMGYVGSVVINALTRFLARNNTKAAQLAAWDAATLKTFTDGADAPTTAIRPPPLANPKDQLAFFGFVATSIALILIPMSFAPEGRHVSLPAILRLYQPDSLAVKPKPTAVPAAVAEPGKLPTGAAALPAGNAANGKMLFASNGCSSCHAIAKDVKLVGPSLYGIWNTAATREKGVDAKSYLYESITKPNAFVVDGYTQNIMPSTFAQALSAQQMADLLAYLEKDLAQK
ncbi:MAG: c-type cytochrome [Thermoflexales bacterium]|nr:c-type cytochrome [Thermoflexales bacterium]